MSAGKTGSTGVVDSAAVFQRLNSLTRQSPAGATDAAAPAEKVDPVAAIENGTEEASGFGAQPAHASVQSDGAAPVSTTATENALWGQDDIKCARPPLETRGYHNLGEGQLRSKIEEVERKQQQLATRIGGRATELDRRWKYLELGKKTEALKQYLGSSSNLTPELRTEVEGAIATSEKAQKRLLELRRDVEKLKPDPKTGKNGTPDKRRDLAEKLFAARRERSQAVEHATAAVDAVGLKIERLTLTEKQIDPSGGAGSVFGSMVALVKDFFHLTFMHQVLFGILMMVIDQMTQALRDDAEASRKQIAEQQWRHRDELLRTMLKEIPLHIAGRRSERVESLHTRTRISDKKSKKVQLKVDNRVDARRAIEKKVAEKKVDEKLEVPKLNLGKI